MRRHDRADTTAQTAGGGPARQSGARSNEPRYVVAGFVCGGCHRTFPMSSAHRCRVDGSAEQYAFETS